MGNDLFVPAHLDTLPAFAEPANLDDAASTILALGKNIHEHAYLIGRTLGWVKTQLPRGQFDGWLKENVWFSRRSAYNFLAFAAACIEAGDQLTYKLNRATVARLSPATDPPDDEAVEPELVAEPDDSEEEARPMPTPARAPVPRASGQEFVEERRVIGEVVPVLKSAKLRILRIAHRYGLSASSRKALRPLLEAMLAAVKEDTE